MLTRSFSRSLLEGFGRAPLGMKGDVFSPQFLSFPEGNQGKMSGYYSAVTYSKEEGKEPVEHRVHRTFSGVDGAVHESYAISESGRGRFDGVRRTVGADQHVVQRTLPPEGPPLVEERAPQDRAAFEASWAVATGRGAGDGDTKTRLPFDEERATPPQIAVSGQGSGDSGTVAAAGTGHAEGVRPGGVSDGQEWRERAHPEASDPSGGAAPGRRVVGWVPFMRVPLWPTGAFFLW